MILQNTQFKWFFRGIYRVTLITPQIKKRKISFFFSLPFWIQWKKQNCVPLLFAIVLCSNFIDDTAIRTFLVHDTFMISIHHAFKMHLKTRNFLKFLSQNTSKLFSSFGNVASRFQGKSKDCFNHVSYRNAWKKNINLMGMWIGINFRKKRK